MAHRAQLHYQHMKRIWKESKEITCQHSIRAYEGLYEYKTRTVDGKTKRIEVKCNFVV
jgi:hypothetical protein